MDDPDGHLSHPTVKANLASSLGTIECGASMGKGLRMGRNAGGWNWKGWLGQAGIGGHSAGAWDRLPAILQAALVWVFLKTGPSAPEDLVRLHDGFCFGERGPIALAIREEPRWMCENLRRVLPTMSWAQAEAAVAVFLAPMIPRSVKNRRLKAAEDGEKGETWGMARRGEALLRGEEAAAFQQWLPAHPLGKAEYLLWLHATWRRHEEALRNRGEEPSSRDPHDQGSLCGTGRLFPLDLGEWWVQKHLFDRAEGIQWGYALWRTAGVMPSDFEHLQVNDLRRSLGPNGGLLVCRAACDNAFIGGVRNGLKDIPKMVRQALDDLDRFDEDPHIEALIRGVEREAFAGVSHWKSPQRARTGVRGRTHTIRIPRKRNCPTGK